MISTTKQDMLITLRLIRKNILSIVGIVIVSLFVVTSLFVALTGMLPYDPNEINMQRRLLPPSFTHPFGTDHLGRDIFSRVLAAAPLDLIVAFTVVSISLIIGLIIGSVAGYYAGKVDQILMRITDVFLAFPPLILAVAVAVALGAGIDKLILALLIVWWPIYSRMARASALSIKESFFVKAAKISGLNSLIIIRKHIIPNTVSTLLIYATLDMGTVILYASVLSYLGLGAQPPQSEWGRMVFDGQSYLIQAWWSPIIPGLVIFFVALGFNLMGDAIRDILDPRYRR
ncbi:MAG: ABC transporter permease [Nitrososphaerales archaeon]